MTLNLGCWLDLPSAPVAEIIGQTGFDFVVIDFEHGAIGIETAMLCMMALKSTGALPIVRVTEASEGQIKRALDAGARGVMVPKVETVAQAEAIVQWFHYAPRGMRGEAQSIVRAADWGRNAAGYSENWRAEHVLIVQIESPEGIENIEAIAAVPGIDMLFFGPADYAASHGIAKNSSQVTQGAKIVADAAKNAGLRAGSVLFPATNTQELAAIGFTDIAVASDVNALVSGLDAALKNAKEIVDAAG